jgi:hypothetical protein
MKSFLRACQATLAGIGIAAIVYCISNPWPIGMSEETDWMWNLAVLPIWGILGGFFTWLPWEFLELYRRCKEYVAASPKEQPELAVRPLPSHAVSALVMSTATALGALYGLQQLGWYETIWWTVFTVVLLVLAAMLTQFLLLGAFPRPDLMAELEASSKKPVLMGQSAEFPTMEQHKRSGKFI